MKIQTITNIYNPFRINKNSNSENNVSNPFINNKLVGDIVSFRAKSYNADSVENPTFHCAYCGCKVYTEQQIDSLAKEMLRDSAHRLQGDIKSVLEKLEAAVRSDELTVAKQLSNKKEIEFYKKFLQQAEDKSWLKGESIFQQVYGLDSEEATTELKKNLRPLTRTIDHVSPQNLGEENKDEDVNLVEACYCCNHDIKEGMPFSEFYRMYPSIKENMPVDKFKYAHAKLLASSSDTILLGVSGRKLIKYVSGLFAQRDKALSLLSNVDFRINESIPSIDNAISECKQQIEEKQNEINILQTKLSSMSEDEEYQAMLERQGLILKQSQLEQDLEGLRNSRKSISEAKNELENPSRKGKKPKTKMSDDQISQKIASYKQQLLDLRTQIDDKELDLSGIQEQLKGLDESYPTPECLQSRKNSYDSIINAYTQLAEEQSNYSVALGISSKLDFDINQLEEQIAEFPSTSFDVSKYDKQAQATYQEYSSLLDTMKLAEQYSKGSGGPKVLLGIAAKSSIEQQLKAFADVPVIVDATNFLKRKDLVSQKEKKVKEKEENDKTVLASKRKIEQLEKTTSKCSLEEAKQQSVDIAAQIRRLNDKQNYLQIPNTIEKLEAEILLLDRTISNLLAKKEEIIKLNIQ